MKRLLILLLTLIFTLTCITSVIACTTDTNTDNVKVIFKQGDVKSIVNVKTGQQITAIPTPIQPEDDTLVTEWNMVDGYVATKDDTIETTTYTKGLQFREYTSNGKPCYDVLGCSEKVSKIVIPQYYRGGQVLTIGESAFRDDLIIEEVVLPEGLTNIWNYAFNYARNLKKVNLPTTLKYIRSSIFNSTSLEGDVLIIPEEVTEIGIRAFGATHYKEIHLTGNVQKLNGYAFWGFDTKTIVWGVNLTHVSVSSFYAQNIEEIFYMGDETDWSKIVYDPDSSATSKGEDTTEAVISRATVYFSSDWEFVDGVPTPL